MNQFLNTMLCKYGKRTRDFLKRFYYYFSLVCYIIGAFLIKQLFHSRRFVGYEMVIANSYPTRARGIIVKYT